ncbi:fimbrial protein [Vibrio parahaemolyticus]|uniref:fimbrial protein n=1 Tax=Vibrio parahaemolyticus TaxID=670 RepID=UPI00301B958B
MIQAKNCTVLAISLLCLAASSVTNATQLNSEQRAAIKEKVAQLTPEQKEKIKTKLENLTPEQKENIKGKLKEKYNSLSDEEKKRLLTGIEGISGTEVVSMYDVFSELNIEDKYTIKQQIFKRVEDKIRALPQSQREALYKELKSTTLPKGRVALISDAVGRLGNVTYGVSGDEALRKLNDLTLSQWSNIFTKLGQEIEARYGDSMLGGELAALFIGLGDIAADIDEVSNVDLSTRLYMPMLLRNPNGADCRSVNESGDQQLLTSGQPINCRTQEYTNAMYVRYPDWALYMVRYAHIKGKLSCAPGWTQEGEYCTNPDIPGAGVKAEIQTAFGRTHYTLTLNNGTQDMDMGKMYKTEGLTGISGGSGQWIDDNCSGPGTAGDCHQGDGYYKGNLPVNVTVEWKMLDPLKYYSWKASGKADDIAKNNLHPFQVEYTEGKDEAFGATLHVNMLDPGYPQGYIVTSFPGWSSSCEINQPEQTVDLGTVYAHDFKTPGPLESTFKPFEIGLSCTGTQKDYKPAIRIISAGSTGGELYNGENTGYLHNRLTDANAAKNVAIAVYYDLPTGVKPVNFYGSPSKYQQEFDLSEDPNPKLKFLAAFYKPEYPGDAITTGKFEADITVEMVYP